jgi:hypothetical protein
MKRSKQNYLDVCCELVQQGDGTYRMRLQFMDWTSGRVDLSTHKDFPDRDAALADVSAAIVMFNLRSRPERDPNREVWRNKPSPAFQRAIWRVKGRLRRCVKETGASAGR